MSTQLLLYSYNKLSNIVYIVWSDSTIMISFEPHPYVSLRDMIETAEKHWDFDGIAFQIIKFLRSLYYKKFFTVWIGHRNTEWGIRLE